MISDEEILAVLIATQPPGDTRRPPPSEWAKIQARAAGNDIESAKASNTRVWNPDHNLIGAFAEWVYAKDFHLPWNESTKLGDGGEDFPGVDVKGTSHHENPWLKRFATDPLKAPFYALVAVNLDRCEGRYVGWATRSELQLAELKDYGHGPTRTLTKLRKGRPE